jgi:hypothetical protein
VGDRHTAQVKDENLERSDPSSSACVLSRPIPLAFSDSSDASNEAAPDFAGTPMHILTTLAAKVLISKTLRTSGANVIAEGKALRQGEASCHNGTVNVIVPAGHMTAPDQLATLNSPLPIERPPHMTAPPLALCSAPNKRDWGRLPREGRLVRMGSPCRIAREILL